MQAGFSARQMSSVTIAGVSMIADLSGALFWEEEACSSSPTASGKRLQLPTRGVLLPPYDRRRR